MEWRAERRRNGWIRCDRDRQREGEAGKVRQRDGHRAQKLCESRGSRPGIPVHNSPYGLCGRKAPFKEEDGQAELRSCIKVEMDVPNSHSSGAV